MKTGSSAPAWAWRLLWLALAALVCWWQGPSFVRQLRPEDRKDIWDFFQEWASARSYLDGLPVYTPLEDSVRRYLDAEPPAPGSPEYRFFNKVNAHPPTAVLLMLPLGCLDYPEAFLAWNLLSLAAFAASLGLVLRQLRIPLTLWSVPVIVALALVCSPLRSHFRQGQLNLFLLLLLTGTWAADRSRRPVLAGALWGLATAVKLFPGFLVLYFALRRQGKALAAGALVAAACTGLTAAVFGVETYQTYLADVLPVVRGYVDEWHNTSLAGFWHKLLDPSAAVHVRALVHSPLLARVGTWVSCAAVIAVAAWVVWRSRTGADTDPAFAVSVIAMLLVSPVTWDHYLVLLLVPLAVLWVRLPSVGVARLAFWVAVVCLWVGVEWGFNQVPGGWRQGTATAGHTLTVLSFQLYALLGLFALGVWMAAGLVSGEPEATAWDATRSPPAPR